MDNISHLFSNRELASAIWVAVFMLFIMRSKGVRGASLNVIKTLFLSWKIIASLLTSALYVSLLVWGLSRLCIWDTSMLKDTILWFVFSFITLFFTLSKVKDYIFFKNLLLDNLKVAVVVEFVINSHTFSLPVELFIVFIITSVTFMQMVVSSKLHNDDSLKVVASFLDRTMAVIGYLTIAYLCYVTYINISEIISTDSAKTILLPITLTVLILPYLYMLCLVMQYELLFVTIKHYRRDEPESVYKEFRRAICRYANFSLTKLHIIWKNHVFYSASGCRPAEYIRMITQTLHFEIGTNAKLDIFNNVEQVINKLSDSELGAFGIWISKFGTYTTNTDLYSFSVSEKWVTKNSIEYVISGEKNSIHSIRVTLNIGMQQDRSATLATYVNIIQKTMRSLELPISKEIEESILSFVNFELEYDSYNLIFEVNDYKDIAWCDFTIKSQLNSL